MTQLTHLDSAGQARMVDVADKAATRRLARAEGIIRMLPATFELLMSGNARKGDALAVARVAAIMASKKTAELVPLCHPIALTRVSVDLIPLPEQSAVRCEASCECVGPTGVEMEALTAVEVGLLTVYDMLKAVDRGMVISDIRLLEKSGGKSGHYLAPRS